MTGAVTPTAVRLALRNAGYVPIPITGKIPPMPRWQKLDPTPDDISGWAARFPDAQSTGVLTRWSPAIDIDIMDHDAAADVEMLLRDHLAERGRFMVRFGQAPKRCILLRTDQPFKKIVVNLIAADGRTDKIEILGEGQQIVVYGIHKDTGKPYSWFGGEPRFISRDELPDISEAEARDLVEAAARLLVEKHGFVRTQDRPKHTGNGSDADAGAADWGKLADNIRTGQALHDSLRDLAAKLVASGMGAGATVNFLRALMQTSTAPHDERWQERLDEIPRLVESAETKFRRGENENEQAGATATGTASGSGQAAGSLDEWDAGDEPGPIPPREWLLGNQFCRGFISSIVAAGGCGKTALRLLQFISLAIGRSLCGQHVFRRCRVLVISLEDDRHELQRRIKAVLDRYGIARAELKGWLFCASPKLAKLAEMKNRTRAIGPLEQQIRDAVERRQPDLIALDPFVKTHSLEENDSGDMDFVCDLLARMAVEFNLAVDSPHHVHKGQVVPGDADSGRGSSGIRDAGRLVYTLCSMSEAEATTFNITEDRGSYIRLDPAKLNIAARSAKATWFRIVGEPIGNGTPEYPNGDTVQVVEVWSPPSAWADTTAAGVNAILNDIARGMANGQRYSNAPNAGDRAVWPVVKKHYPQKTEGQCREIIHAWLASGLLHAEDYADPVQRHSRKGLYVDDAKRPS
jgi:hypothetical protein